METILVTVSVLSTLLVVGIVLGIVIVFNKLKGKVDVEVVKKDRVSFEKEIEILHNIIDSREENIRRELESVEKDLWRSHEKMQEEMERNFEDIMRTIDSRVDRLYEKLSKRDVECNHRLDSLENKIGDNKQLLTD